MSWIIHDSATCTSIIDVYVTLQTTVTVVTNNINYCRLQTAVSNIIVK